VTLKLLTRKTVMVYLKVWLLHNQHCISEVQKSLNKFQSLVISTTNAAS